ncbi:hypothetical protein N7450_008403 [Penicillium hetheringtonii]|uniref:NAD-dependent epimerase/dehydratase domain-containing protein n=1 Tax=Penicillium hetheringtonii TaxID=911720 RepID=A0AAD6DCW4_9EURO|nr:hypothetical protein N7450_008403 [Penicillium hetheringtonii]
MTDANKPAVLIIGGLGFIGRHVALHLHENQLASEVRLVDKVLPQLAWLAPEFEEACSKEKFVQADASREQHLPRIFDRANGEQFDYVINCGGETRHSQPDDVYEARSCNLSIMLGKEIAKRGIKSYVECSTAHVYKSGSSPRKELDKLQPWHKLAKWKLKAAEEILKIPDLELLYTKDVKVNTLHVKDAASALFEAAKWRAGRTASSEGTPSIFKEPSAPWAFNVVDHNETQQEHVANALAEVFGLKVTFIGSLVSQLAKMNLDDAVDDMNEVSLQEWAELIEKSKIERPGPISPFLELDVLKDQDMSIDGSLFESTVGWKPKYERFNADSVRAMVDSYKRMGWWP